MSSWQRSVAGAIESVERRLDQLKQRLGSPSAITIVPYRSYGSGDRLLVRGRVLGNNAVRQGRAEDSIWQNLLNTYRRLESDEIAGACIRASQGTDFSVTLSNDEGFFSLWLAAEGAWSPGQWVPVSIRLCQPPDDAVVDHGVEGEVLVPSADAQFGVISDIDDTVIQTYATELLRMARLTLLGNARTRLPFPGVAAFYRALHEGHGSRNPVFYVSSSPWNLYDLLVDFFVLQNIPPGPMFLRDWGIHRDEFLPTEHSGHKLGAIEELFEFYPDLPFILIGDSGQHDPEIYAEVVRRYGRRVLAVYIRDVSPDDRRDNEIRSLAGEVTAAGSSLILAGDTMRMAQHAAQNSWIETEALDEIAEEIRATETAAVMGLEDEGEPVEP